MGDHLIRILSDVHFGDRGSRVRSLDQLRPLLDGATSLVLNGDTLDTRPGTHAGRTAQMRADVLGFFGSGRAPVTFLTGNHDPDLSREHALEFASGKILVTHGDVLFESIVPWSRDAGVIRSRIISALASVPDTEADSLEGRIAAFRSVAATIPQLHQSETNPIRYALRLAGDTVWPPDRAFRIFKAWREAPAGPRTWPAATAPGRASSQSGIPTSPACGRARPALWSSTRAHSAGRSARWPPR